ATFIDSVISVQDFGRIRNQNWIHIKWGWIETNCDDIASAQRNTEHTLNLQSIEFSYQHGLMKFNLKGLDMSQVTFESATDETFGTDE
ncbi:hypothetical protein ABTK71_19660, partial [Acinetobacter baumannii]